MNATTCVVGLPHMKTEKNELTPNDYIRVAEILARRLVALAQSAGERSMKPPFELHVTGADDRTVLHVSFAEGLKLRDVSGLSGNTLLSACFPLTATVTDTTGSVIELRIERDEGVQ
jgi:hypothetical protein